MTIIAEQIVAAVEQRQAREEQKRAAKAAAEIARRDQEFTNALRAVAATLLDVDAGRVADAMERKAISEIAIKMPIAYTSVRNLPIDFVADSIASVAAKGAEDKFTSLGLHSHILAERRGRHIPESFVTTHIMPHLVVSTQEEQSRVVYRLEDIVVVNSDNFRSLSNANPVSLVATTAFGEQHTLVMKPKFLNDPSILAERANELVAEFINGRTVDQMLQDYKDKINPPVPTPVSAETLISKLTGGRIKQIFG